ncbi:MAG: sigma 54-interacting transcriptional regulator [Deltaproteobacteria bacterium]|nr:sigma 54-interacting transcriptional regulator [Deltaproteobacteria bacterium]
MPDVSAFNVCACEDQEIRNLLEAVWRDLNEERNRVVELENINEKLLLEITQLERTQKALIQSEMRCSTVLEAARDYIFIKDTELRYVDANSALLEMLGQSRDMVIGKTFEEIKGIEVSPKVIDAERRVLSGQTVENEYSFMISGRRVNVSAIRTPLKNSSGHVIGLCGIARDITERREINKWVPEHLERYTSPVFRKVLEQLSLAAPSDSTILLLGESGVGKDYLARHVHERSNRSGAPFFAINCAALTPSLAESELFGYESGAFTGVRGKKRGLLELAEGGTLLLNEIGELSIPLQAKLLSFLDTMTFTRVGGEKEVAVNTRILAATNKDLEKDVKVGLFRPDLLFRLNVFPVIIPPLRERPEDLPVLVDEIVKSLAQKLGFSRIPPIEKSALIKMSRHEWPGNVRELTNALERALILSSGACIREADLGLIPVRECPHPVDGQTSELELVGEGESFPDTVKRLKRSIIQKSLEETGGNVTAAAKLLGITRDAMRHMMKTFGFQKSNFNASLRH